MIGTYVADFACMAKRLVIEVDGSQHGFEANQRRDEARTRWPESEGYRVMRFWNNDVMSRTEAVLEAIHDMLGITPPHPACLRQATLPLKGRVVLCAASS